MKVARLFVSVELVSLLKLELGVNILVYYIYSCLLGVNILVYLPCLALAPRSVPVLVTAVRNQKTVCCAAAVT